MNEQCLSLAIQKSGRLSEPCKSLLERCGIEFDSASGRLINRARNFPLELLFIRDDDIPRCVAEGTIDAGIIGENVLLESDVPIDIVEKLGFGRCRLALAAPKASKRMSLDDIRGSRIATSYPKTLERFLASQDITAHVVLLRGSVEVAPSLGLSDAICDIVSTGSTLVANGLAEICTVAQSEAVLASSKDLTPAKEAILERLAFRIRAIRAAERKRYLVLNAPDSAIEAITNVLPAATSPTLIPLARKGWHALHTIVPEEKLWQITEEVKALGGEAIFIVQVEGEVP